MAKAAEKSGSRTRVSLLERDEEGTLHSFSPGDVLPDWVLERISRDDILLDAGEVVVEVGAYDDMNTKQLLALAKQRELDLETTDRNEIIDALRMWDDANDG